MNWYLAAMKNYAGFSGRARRKEYWMFALVYIVIYLAASIVGGMLSDTAGPMLAGLVALAHFIPLLAAGWRRMHDTDRPGWWAIVPIAGLIFAFMEGTRGPNQYGPDPKMGG